MYNDDLTANSQKFEASYQNGKYGFMINGTFYEIGGGGMPELNYTNPLHTFGAGNLTFTATKECYLLGQLNDSESIVTINNTAMWAGGVNTLVPLSRLSAGDVVVETIDDVNYTYAYENQKLLFDVKYDVNNYSIVTPLTSGEGRNNYFKTGTIIILSASMLAASYFVYGNIKRRKRCKKALLHLRTK